MTNLPLMALSSMSQDMAVSSRWRKSTAELCTTQFTRLGRKSLPTSRESRALAENKLLDHICWHVLESKTRNTPKPQTPYASVARPPSSDQICIGKGCQKIMARISDSRAIASDPGQIRRRMVRPFIADD